MPALAADTRRLIYPRFNKDPNPDTWYPVQLLRWALSAANYPVELEATSEELPQLRSLHDLQRPNGRMHVMWTMTTAEREHQVLPVRIPIYRGLFGWRLLVARKERVEELRSIATLADLRRFTMMQGAQWPDTEILRSNGVPVMGSISYEAMFNQLRLGRADAFPRSVEEVNWEMGQYGDGLAIVPDVALYYPTAIYYFVRPGDTELAAAIEVGLTRLRASGQFERLFNRFHGETLARAKLGQRRVIELTNPLLSPETPLGNKELWYRP
jgi:hypothetical protein